MEIKGNFKNLNLEEKTKTSFQSDGLKSSCNVRMVEFSHYSNLLSQGGKLTLRLFHEAGANHLRSYGMSWDTGKHLELNEHHGVSSLHRILMLGIHSYTPQLFF